MSVRSVFFCTIQMTCLTKTYFHLIYRSCLVEPFFRITEYFDLIDTPICYKCQVKSVLTLVRECEVRGDQRKNNGHEGKYNGSKSVSDRGALPFLLIVKVERNRETSDTKISYNSL